MNRFTDIDLAAVKELMFKMADDQLILGHRNSEWTGLGPILEEDIAFSSMAQDKLGHAQAIYQLLQKSGEADPDSLAFGRSVNDFRCCHLVEYPISGYDFSLMRHFLFDTSEAIRFDMLAHSSYEPLSAVAKKFRGEIRYHTMHAETWVRQLGNAGEASNHKMQKALDMCFPLALGIFEPSEFEAVLIEQDIFGGEKSLKNYWLERVREIAEDSGLEIPDVPDPEIAFGGRRGSHTEYLEPLLREMTEVYSIDPDAEW